MGIVFAVLYGLLSVIIGPFFLLAALFGAKNGIIGVGLALMFPIIYAVMGFVLGVTMAAICNLVVKWTGGLEFAVRDLAAAV